MGIPELRAIGKTDGACFIKKSAKEKDNIQFYERAARTWVPVGTLCHERTENCRGARVKSAGIKATNNPMDIP